MNICKHCGTQLRKVIIEGQGAFATKCNNPLCTGYADVEVKSKKEIFFKRIEKLKKSNSVNIMISNLKRLRVESFLSQKDVAPLLDVSTQRYGGLERCENLPTVPLVGKISNVYGVSMSGLYSMTKVSLEEYQQLRNMSEFDGVVKYDPLLEKYRNDIDEYENITGIMDRKVYKDDNEDIEIIQKKEKLKELDAIYSKYNSKKAILKQDCVIDYFNYIDAMKLINSNREEGINNLLE